MTPVEQNEIVKTWIVNATTKLHRARSLKSKIERKRDLEHLRKVQLDALRYVFEVEDLKLGTEVEFKIFLRDKGVLGRRGIRLLLL